MLLTPDQVRCLGPETISIRGAIGGAQAVALAAAAKL
jgi:hypothetical protein